MIYKERHELLKRAILLIIIVATFLFSGCVMSTPEAPSIHEESGLTVYFIDVGQADSSLVICDGHAMLIDGGNAADSDLIYTFLREHKVNHLDYIVATHAHEDHIGGLAGALNYATVDIAYCPVDEYDSKAFSSFVKYLGEQGKAITIPRHGDTFILGGSIVDVIAPVKQYDNTNNTSIVLRLTYHDVSFLFTGDCEREAEADILESGYELSATVLKVGHHGSDTSTSYPFLREVMPQYAVISCGSNNQYGHPHDDTLSKLRDADVTVFRTDMQGTIICNSDGFTVSFAVDRNADAVTNPTKPFVSVDEEYYIGNINSKRVHRPSCSGLPNEKNRVLFTTLGEATDAGYTPCGTCKP